MKNITSLIDAILYFKSQGFVVEFNLREGHVQHPRSKQIYQPEQLHFIHEVKIEQESDPDDTCLVYAVKTADGERGIIIDAAGAYAGLDGISGI